MRAESGTQVSDEDQEIVSMELKTGVSWSTDRGLQRHLEQEEVTKT